MRHVLFFNVGGRGYTAYAGGAKESLHEQDLWVSTPHVSESMVKAKRHVYDALSESKLPVSMAFRHDEGALPVVAYGCIFPKLKDDKGREGLIFLHAIELNDPAELAAAVDVILQRLGPDALRRMNDRLGRMALAPDQPRELGQRVCARVEELIGDRFATWTPPDVRTNDLGMIVHDCIDGASWAWRVFAYALTGASPGWSVYDVIEGHVPRTCRNPSLSMVAQASDVIRNVANSSLDRVVAQDSGAFVGASGGLQPFTEDGFDLTSTGRSTPMPVLEAPAEQARGRRFKPWWLVAVLLVGGVVLAFVVYPRDSEPTPGRVTPEVEGGAGTQVDAVVDAGGIHQSETTPPFDVPSLEVTRTPNDVGLELRAVRGHRENFQRQRERTPSTELGPYIPPVTLPIVIDSGVATGRTQASAQDRNAPSALVDRPAHPRADASESSHSLGY